VVAFATAIFAWLGALNPFKRRRKPPPIMRPYVDLRRPLRRVGRLIFPLILIFCCFVYGFFYALTTPYLLLPFTAPIVVLVLLSIWALPDTPHAPLRTLEWLFAAVLICRVLWPNYLALQLPGLPWFTALRVFGFPFGFLLLITLSTSARFRSDIWQSIRACPGLAPCFIGLAIMNFVTLPLSKAPASSLQLALLELIYMVGMIVVASWTARTPGRASRYFELLMILALPIMLMTLVEFKAQRVLWSGHVPTFLQVDDPAAIRAMSDSTRGATGAYRTKATFSTALGLAEYLAILTSFYLHYTFHAKSVVIKVANGFALAVSFFCIYSTDARLGMVGFLVSILAYVLYWGLVRFARDRRDLVGATVVYGYPAFFLMTVGAVLSIHRLRIMVLGGGEAASSNEARGTQISAGIPKILANPIGHGIGQSGQTLGVTYTDFITVDNYYLTMGLDNGFVGLITFIGIFVTPIVAILRILIKYPKILDDREIGLLLPSAVSFTAFLVIKSVFSQPDTHMLLYAMVGLCAGLLYRARRMVAAEEETAVTTALESSSRRTGRRGINGDRPVGAYRG
jgi:hypothetical protein